MEKYLNKIKQFPMLMDLITLKAKVRLICKMLLASNVFGINEWMVFELFSDVGYTGFD